MTEYCEDALLAEIDALLDQLHRIRSNYLHLLKNQAQRDVMREFEQCVRDGVTRIE